MMMLLPRGQLTGVTVPEVLQDTGVVAEGGCPPREGLMTGWQAGRLLPAEVTTEAEAEEGLEGIWEAEELVETVEKASTNEV